MNLPPTLPAALPPASELRRVVLATGLCYVAFLAAYVLGYWLGDSGRLTESTADREAIREALSSPERLGNLGRILATNLVAVLGIAALGGLSRGILSVASIALFGLSAGLTSGALHRGGLPGSFLASYHLTHGVLEILGLSVAGAAGIAGGSIFSRYLKGGSVPRRAEFRQLGWIMAVSALILVAAAAIEAYATPGVALRYLD